MFFNSWESIVQTIVTAVIVYAALVFLLLISGKRTLSKMNAFDFVVTVSIGSTLSSIVLDKDIAIAQGVTALCMLIGLQYVVTWLSVRSETFKHMVKSTPRLLFHNQEFLSQSMVKERITKDEVLAAIRLSGYGSLDEVDSVILETDSSFSVLKKTGKKVSSTITGPK